VSVCLCINKNVQEEESVFVCLKESVFVCLMRLSMSLGESNQFWQREACFKYNTRCMILDMCLLCHACYSITLFKKKILHFKHLVGLGL